MSSRNNNGFKYLLRICIILAVSDVFSIRTCANMITSWNESGNLPTPLAESISGYNSYENVVWILGGWNGTVKTDLLFTFDTVTNEFTVQDYPGDKIAIAASSYTWIRDSMFFTNDFILYELTMIYNVNYNPKLNTQHNLPLTHYADTPSITTDPDQQKYLFVTGGIVNGSVVNTLSIYDLGKHNWISIPTPNMKYPRLGHNCIARNNYLYIFGGYINRTHTINKVEKLYIGDIENITLESWRELNSTLNNDIAYMRIAEVDGLIYIIGGYSATFNSSLNTVNILDPTTDEIMNGVNLSHDTNRGAVTENINGIVYLFGGYSNSSTLSIWQWSISDNNESSKDHDHLLWLYMTILGITVMMITTCFFVWRRWHGKCTFSDMRKISYGGAGQEGQSDRRNLVDREVGGKYVIDTASFESCSR